MYIYIYIYIYFCSLIKLFVNSVMYLLIYSFEVNGKKIGKLEIKDVSGEGEW